MEITLMTDSFFIIILLNKENSKKTKLLSERPNILKKLRQKKNPKQKNTNEI